MDIALTGGTGRLGSFLVPALLGQGHCVRLLVQPGSERGHRVAQRLGVACEEVSMHDVAGLAGAIKGADVVIHAAALQTGPEAIQRTLAVDGTQALLEAILCAGVHHLVGISSLAVYDYHGLTPGSRLDESSPLESNPDRRDTYTRCKRAQDRLFLDANRADLRVVVLRPGIFYETPLEWPFALGKALGRFWMLMGPLNRHSHIPFVHTADVADGVAQAVAYITSERWHAGRCVFNLTETPAPASVELLRALCSRAPRPLVRWPWWLHQGIAKGLWSLNEVLGHPMGLPGLLNPHCLASRFCTVDFDASRAREHLGWKPRHALLPLLNSPTA